MSKVALVMCTSYDYSEVKKAVKRGLDLIGGPLAFVKPGENILLKPNLLTGDPPEKCVTTHPEVFKAVGEILLGAGANLSYGDSPGFGSPESAARKAGIAQAAADLHIELADFRNGEEVFFEAGVQNKKFVIAKGALASDGIVSLPKLKTHALTRMTGSIKNQFGCVPGVLKGEYHVKLPDLNNFAQMLVDLNSFLKPRLFVMDGIMAMEGNGPRGGKPRQMNVLLFSSDPVALDATVCRMVGLKAESIPTLELGMKSGLGSYLESDIELLGDDLSQFITFDFDVKKESSPSTRKIPSLLTNLLVPKPFINKEGCVMCGVCVNMCPVMPKVLDWDKGDKTKPPVYDYNRCIRCYCCQELCPESTIVVKVPLMRRGLDRIKR
ncbi:MAG: hypothetical protein CVU90_02765 [Firmicutes bacterium HGW-Firmicutes-15]|nr:MAG: hypothetical protein CVU90_02765 [Firmicutes bacterium HGW-Firmicutes-15]